MPRIAICAPRTMLPPPLTIASSTPLSAAAAISLASAWTSSLAMPGRPSPENDSPETFSRTRRQRGAFSATSGGAHLEDGDAHDLDRAARGLARALEGGLDVGHLGRERRARPRLLEQALVGEELVELALEDLLDHRRRLVGHLGIGLGLLAVDLHLLLGERGRDFLATHARGLGERDMHREPLREVGDGLARERLRVALPLDQHARLGVVVEVVVDARRARERDRAAHGHVLADLRHEVLDRRVDGLALAVGPAEDLRRRHLSVTARRLRHHEVGDAVDERLEVGAVHHGLGLAVDLDHRGGLAVLGDADRDAAFLHDPVGLLGRRLEALLAKPLDGLLRVAARGLEGLLALHHRQTRGLPKLHDDLRGDLGHGGAAHDAFPAESSFFSSFLAPASLGSFFFFAGAGAASFAGAAPAAGAPPPSLLAPSAPSVLAASASAFALASGVCSGSSSIGRVTPSSRDPASCSRAWSAASVEALARRFSASARSFFCQSASTWRRRSSSARLASSARRRSASTFSCSAAFICQALLPASTASASRVRISETERIASSLPGMAMSTRSGSQSVSRSATTGVPVLLASATAMCS